MDRTKRQDAIESRDNEARTYEVFVTFKPDVDEKEAREGLESIAIPSQSTVDIWEHKNGVYAILGVDCHPDQFSQLRWDLDLLESTLRIKTRIAHEPEYEEALGDVVRQERTRLGLSAEHAARSAKVAYKTWLRIESGKPVRNQSWSGVDRLFGLPEGTAVRIKSDPSAKPQTGAERLRGEIERVRTGRDAASGSQAEAKRHAAATGSGHATALAAPASGEGTVTGPSLAERIRGLDLDELRRLRDMVEGAIIAREHPDIEKKIATAAIQVAEASNRASSLWEKLEQEYPEQLPLESELRDQYDTAREALILAEHEYNVLRDRAHRLDKALNEGLSSIEEGTDDGER